MIVPVEIKVNIEGDVDAALAEFRGQLDTPLDRQIFFAESRAGAHAGELRLYDQHVILRLRTGEKNDDLTVKLRPCTERQLVGRWAAPKFESQSFEYRVEGDWSATRRVLSASAVDEHDPGALAHVTSPDADPSAAFSDHQCDFLRQCAGAGEPVRNLVALGPVASSKWTDVAIGDFEADMERWTLPGLDFLELSIRIKPKNNEAADHFEDRVAAKQAEFENAVRERGLPIAALTDNKTQRVLRALADRLRSQ